MKTLLRPVFLFSFLCLCFVLTAYAQDDTLNPNGLEQKGSKLLFQNLTGVREVTTIDYDLGMAVTTLEKDGQVIGIVEIVPLSVYLARQRTKGVRQTWSEIAQKSTAKREQESEGGLIPTVELPIKLPAPVAGIIGQGGSLDVKGSQGIEFGGSRHFELQQKQTELTHQSAFPELKMKQHLIVNLKGTVGEKVNVFVDHDSERETETKNKIKLQYQGDEDEIIQQIEAGDTDLSLPGARLIGGPPTHKGLFGIKGMAKVGPVNITAIASKEQGKSEQLTISGGAIAETLKIEDIRFIRWRFFRIPVAPGVTLKSNIKVFVDDGNGSNDDGTVFGRALLDPRNPLDTTDVHSGRFDLKQLDQQYYMFDSLNNILLLSKEMQQNQEVLAVAYVTVNGDTVGTFKDLYAPGDTVALQLIKPKFPSPTSRTWDYELKNFYNLGATYLKPPLDLRVRKFSYSAEVDAWTQGDKTFLELLGLDKSPPDGSVDVEWIWWDEGILRFPYDRPFEISDLAVADSIYEQTTFTDYTPKYYIEVVAKGTKTTFNLNAINIMDGSVTVKLNGRDLVVGQDYSVDYDMGTVTLLTPEASRPDADVTISYQYAPFLSLASKSLLGSRATYQIGENAEVGTSWMYRTVATKELRPKLGEESKRILVGEADGHVDAEPYIFTRLVDLLPLVSTDAKSSLKLSGDAAVSMPNPNTQGEVFIDDMEGTKTSYSLGLTRPGWSYGSIPHVKDTTNFGSPAWYNPKDGIRAKELDPNLSPDRANDQITYLVLSNRLYTAGQNTWVSLNRSLSSAGIDFSKSRALEVWVRGDTGMVHIDIGTNIPEDAPRRDRNGSVKGVNHKLDTEDVKTVNGELDWNEDTGLDTVPGDDAKHVSGDDGNDDYYYAPGSNDYSKVNGTENNQRMDTEDLNGNYVLDMREDFFEFSFDLTRDDFVVNRGANNWRLLRIALDDSLHVTGFGNPDWKNIISARIWVDGFNHRDSVEIAGLDIVGNKWRNGGVSGLLPDQGGTFEPEERIELSVKNNERDKDYTTPFDPGTDPYGNKRREQSLVMDFFNINSMHRAIAYQLTSQKQDYSDYKTIKLYVHGDTSNPTFFIKFGGDERNTYEYREVVGPGWHEIVLPITEFTNRKLEHEGEPFYFDKGGVGYGFYGQPSFRNVMRLEIGILNQGSKPVTGEIWVDELRLTDPKRNTGTSSSISLDGAFADLLGVSVDLNREDSEFRGLNSETGSGVTKTSFGTSGNMSLDKFLPEKWGMSIPVTGSFTRDLSLPKYQQSSDIVLSDEKAQERASHNLRRGASMSIHKSKPSLNRFLRWTVDKVQFTSSVGQNYSDTETRIDSSAAYNSSASYSYNPQVNPLSIFGLFGISYFPKQFGFSGGYNENQTVGYVKSDTMNVLTGRDHRKVATAGADVDYDPLEFVSTSYSVNVTHDLAYPESLRGYNVGREVGRSQSASVSYRFPLFTDFVSQSVNYDTKYDEDHDPKIGGLEKDLRNAGNSNTATANLTVNLGSFLNLFSGFAGPKGDTLKPGVPGRFVGKFLDFANRITSPSGTYTRNKNSQYNYLKGRPPWKYQFGLADDIGVEKEYYQLNQSNLTDNYQARSGLDLGLVGYSISFRGSDSKGGTVGSKTKSNSVTWPDMSLTLRTLEKFIPKIVPIQSSEVRSGYSVTKGESGPIDQAATTKSTSSGFSPLLSWRATWQKRIETELSTDYTVGEKKSGTPLTTGTDTKREVSMKLSYSFSAPTGMSLPFLGGKLKFKSNLDLSLLSSYAKGFSKLATEGSNRPPKTNSDSESFSISPKATYNFSKSVTGGLSGQFSQNRDKQRGRTGRDVSAEFNVLFKF
jgi:hypothetical protein